MGYLDKLANHPDYAKGLNLTGNDFLLNWQFESWIQVLEQGQKRPRRLRIFAGRSNSQGYCHADTVKKCGQGFPTASPGDNISIWKGDIFYAVGAAAKGHRKDLAGKFAGLVIPRRDFKYETSWKEFPCYPMHKTMSPGGQYLWGHNCVPLRSVTDGGGWNGSSEAAEARNKSQGLFRARGIVSRDLTISLSGTYYKKDPGVALLAKAWMNSSKNIFYQGRLNPFLLSYDDKGREIAHGRGYAAVECQTVLTSFSVDASARNEYQQVTAELMLSGQPRYTTLPAPSYTGEPASMSAVDEVPGLAGVC